MSLIPERRDNPAKFDSGSIVFPVYSHVPGIGSTYGVGGTATNILSTKASVVGVGATGDTSLAILGLTEVHLVPDRLVTSYYLYSTKIPFQNYERGIASDSNTSLYSLNKEYGGSAEVDFNFWQRRIQINTQIGASRLQYQSVLDADGTSYVNTDRSEFTAFNPTVRLILDFTDDNFDPHRGVKMTFIRDQTFLFDGLHSRYSTFYAMSTVHVPVLKSSTWAFNFFRSMAMMESQNNMSASQLRAGMALGCDQLSDPSAVASCQASETRRVQQRSLENSYGNAGSLGGPEQLRGFPLGRFRGSQALFWGTEFRLNMIDQAQKFDFGFMNGTASVVQVAPFLEMGTVCDPPQTIEQVPFRATYGVGFRFGFSGALVRADVASSDEGPQFTFFFGYPWDMSPF